MQNNINLFVYIIEPHMFETSLHSHFKNEICWVFFQLNRKEPEFCFDELSTRLRDCLLSIKKRIDSDPSNEYSIYLHVLYKCIGFIRDNRNGLGEHHITYVFIYAFYNTFPTLAIKSIREMITPPTTDHQPYYLGCWKDLKQLCHYVYNKTYNRDHEIIIECVNIMNAQLLQDWETWKFSTHCFSKLHISNVSKFIPRENSKYGWLFDILANHWTRTHKPYIFKFINNPLSSKRATLKSKMIYRKLVSYLNKSLHTTEIFLCNRNICDLNMDSVSCHTANQHKNVFLQLHNNDLDIIFKEHIQQNKHHKIPRENEYFTHGTSFSKLSIYTIIQYAMQSYENTEQPFSLNHSLFIEANWCKSYRQQISRLNKLHIIPLIDVSYDMKQNSLYNAIGLGILLSYMSLYKNRLIAVDRQSSWIAFDANATIIDIVSTFMDSIFNMRNTTANFENAILIILEGLKSQKKSPAIRDINIVILSNFNNSTINESTIESLFAQQGFSYFPKIVYWNVNESRYVDVPCSHNSTHSFCVSGYSTCHLHSFQQMGSTYEYIVNILSQKRFARFDNYIKQLLN